MGTFKLKRDVTVQFREYEVSAKAGARVLQIGEQFAIDRRDVDAGAAGSWDRYSIFQHDSTYYYVWVDAAHVESGESAE